MNKKPKFRCVKSGLWIMNILIILLLSFIGGCGSDGAAKSDKSLNKSSDGDHASLSGKAMIGSSTGGALSVEMDDGALVMIDIPGSAMRYSTEICLTVKATSSGNENIPSELTITIEPAITLLEPAQLSVTYPGKTNTSAVAIFEEHQGKIPLKQSMEERVLSGVLYHLGVFSTSVPDENEMSETAGGLISRNGDGTWQDAYSTFNALVWFADYFSTHGYPEDVSDCFNVIGEKSRQSAMAFVDSVGHVEKGGRDYNTYLKFRSLMILCENPEQILDLLDQMVTSTDS